VGVCHATEAIARSCQRLPLSDQGRQMASDSEDEIHAVSLFSDKQVAEFKDFYPDYVRLKDLIAREIMTDHDSEHRRSQRSRSSDQAERIAAAGSGEVMFRSLLDEELAKVNQFVVTASSELRQQVADLERDVASNDKNADELLASVQRCSMQVVKLEDFTSLSQAIFLRVLSDHDAVSDTPMLLGFSSKLYYQPFLQSKCTDLPETLARMEQTLLVIKDQQMDEEEAQNPPADSRRGLDEPLLGKTRSTAKLEKGTSTGVLARMATLVGLPPPEAPKAKPPPAKVIKLTPPKIEPKVYFANERTFLHWMHMCVTLGAVAMAIMAEGTDEPALAVPGLVLTALSGVFILYAWYLFMWRAEALKAKVDHLDDRIGPTLFVVSVVAAMVFVGYKKIAHAMEEEGAW